MAGIKACVICLVSLVRLGAQITDPVWPDNNMPSRGLVPTGLFAVSDLETINVVNGNLLFRIPLASLPGYKASGLTAGFNLTYNSQIYDISYDPGFSQAGNTQTIFQHLSSSRSGGGWQYGYMYGLSLDNRPGPGGFDCITGTEDQRKMFKLSLISPDGSHHTLHLYPNTPGGSYWDFNGDGYYEVSPAGTTNGCPGTPAPVGDLTYYTTDGSYLKVVVSQNGGAYWSNHQWTIYFPDGGTATGFGPQMISLADHNGNSISFVNAVTPYPYAGAPTTSLVDNLGRSISIQYNPVVGSTSQDAITQTGFSENGVPHTLAWTVTWGNFFMTGSPLLYICSPLGDTCLPDDRMTQRVPIEVDLPTPEDNSTQKFTFCYGCFPLCQDQ
jgi:hypothetical protein